MSRRARLAVETAVVAASVIDWVGCGRPVDLGRFLAAHLVDDLSYCAGVWRGCLTHPTVAPLRPKLVRFPPSRS